MHRPAIGALAVEQSLRSFRQHDRHDLADDDVMSFPQHRGRNPAFETRRSTGKDRLTDYARQPRHLVEARGMFAATRPAGEEVGELLLVLLQEVGAAFRDHGTTAAITALVGGTIALLAAVTRIAFTNDAMLARLDRELAAERDRADRQRAEDRDDDADRLERIEADIRAMRDLMFEAFQRGRTD